VMALDGLHAGGTFLEGVARALGQRTPTFGTPVAQLEASQEAEGNTAPAPESEPDSERFPSASSGQSEPPIPLVKKHGDNKRERRGTNPGMGEFAIPAIQTLGEDADGEPILG